MLAYRPACRGSLGRLAPLSHIRRRLAAPASACLLALQQVGQVVAQDHRVAVRRVACGGQQGDRAAVAPGQAVLDRLRSGGQLGQIAPPELGPSRAVGVEPFAQIAARRDLLRPGVERKRGPGEPARTQPVDRQPGAVPGGGGLMDPRDSEGKWVCPILRCSPPGPPDRTWGCQASGGRIDSRDPPPRTVPRRPAWSAVGAHRPWRGTPTFQPRRRGALDTTCHGDQPGHPAAARDRTRRPARSAVWDVAALATDQVIRAAPGKAAPRSRCGHRGGYRRKRRDQPAGAALTSAMIASIRSRAFLGSFTVLAASRFEASSPTWISATMPIPRCGVHLMP